MVFLLEDQALRNARRFFVFCASCCEHELSSARLKTKTWGFAAWLAPKGLDPQGRCFRESLSLLGAPLQVDASGKPNTQPALISVWVAL